MSAVYCVLVVYAFSQVVIFFDLGNPFGKYFFDSIIPQKIQIALT